MGLNVPDEEIFGRPAQDSRLPRGWLVDLINSFGNLGGFQILLERFQSGENLSVAVMYALLRPFGLCYELLTVHTIVKYLMPIIVSYNLIPCILASTKSGTKNEFFSGHGSSSSGQSNR